MLRRAVLTATVLVSLLHAADDPWRFIDPASKMIMGVEWQRLKDSPTGARLRRQMSENLPIPSLPPLKFLHNIDSMLVASPGLAEGAPQNEQPPVMIVASGHFDLAQVRASVKKKSRRAVVQNVEIFESTDRESVKFGMALVSPEILLFGDVPSLVLALGYAAAPDNSFIARARQLDTTNEFWLVSSISPADIAGQGMPIPLPIPIENVRSLDLGISLHDGLGLELAVGTASEEDAVELKTQFSKTIKLAAKEKTRPDMAGIDKHLKITAEGEFLKLSLKLEAADLEKRMLAFEARRKVTPAPAPTVAATATATVPSGPSISKPVIWNLDPQD